MDRMEESHIREACEVYLKASHNETDNKAIQTLLDANNIEELGRRMFPRITFGTSGLRGRMEAGFARMNDLTVFQASLGLRDYVLENVPDAVNRGIVIGHDHRHNSQRFAEITLSVFSPVMKVCIFGTLVHTPLVPFSVKELKAACGVMITASHNPKLDNGYKVYWENACAIIPPHDHGIAQKIDLVAAEAGPDLKMDTNNVHNIYEQMTKAYFSRVFGTMQSTAAGSSQKEFRFVYTPMHGVGLIYARVAMSDSQHSTVKTEMIVVAEQALPDPEFSTVKFPNPEEAGALNLAMQTADAEGANLVVATDPDADRLGAAEKVNGKWQVLTGNQIGVLLASELIKETTGDKRAMLSSAVSSRMLGVMAEREGLHWEETLTGFKWLGNRALQLREEGYNVILSYEEALGFMPYDIVFDKDGILSMTVLIRLAKDLHVQGKTLTSKLQSLYETYGFFSSANSYFTITDPEQLKRVMAVLRHPAYPSTLGSRRVTRVRDLTTGSDSSTADKLPTLPVSKSSEMLTFWFGPNEGQDATAVMTIRGSGTEPKLKYYIEAQAKSIELAISAAQDLEQDLEKIWFKDFILDKP